MAPRALVLGSGAGGGVPQWNCRCRICTLARAGDPRVQRRTQAGVALTGDGATWTLIGASPDLRAQLEAAPPLHPATGLRHSPIDAVVLASAEIDHVAGLLTMRERQPFRLIATEPVLRMLAANPIFDALSPECVKRQCVAPGQLFAGSRGVELRLVPVPGKVPLYAEHREDAADEADFTLAVVAEINGKRIACMPACAAVTDTVLDVLRSADVVLFDGTVFTDAELIEAGVSEKTGRRMGHIAMSGPEGSLARLAGLRAGRRIYMHLNNTNPVLVAGSAEQAIVERAGWEIATDGMEIAL